MCIWSIARLTKCAAPLINLSVAQHLTNCAIFDQSHSALARGLGLGLRLGLVLELGLGLHNWPNAQHVWSNVQRVRSNAQIDQMHLTAISSFLLMPSML